MKELLKSIKTNSDDAESRKPLVLRLANRVRTELSDEVQPFLQRYLQDSIDGVEIKLETVGTMIRDVARLEFLLGWMHEGGYSRNGKWEIKGKKKNEGPFPDHYQNRMHGGTEDAWCIQFAGYSHKVMGFRFDRLAVLSKSDNTRSAVRHSIFRSGSRFRHWARTGVNYINSKERMTPESETLRKRLEGGFSYSLHNWQQMATQSHSPRAGDIVSWWAHIRTKPGKTWKAWKPSGHTVMIDDAANDSIYTVEGNNGDGAGARVVNLRNPNTDRFEWRVRAIHWARPGLDWYVDESHRARYCRVLSDDVMNGDFNVITMLAPSRDVVMDRTSRLVEQIANFCADAKLHNGPWIKNHNSTARVWDWVDHRVRYGVL